MLTSPTHPCLDQKEVTDCCANKSSWALQSFITFNMYPDEENCFEKPKSKMTHHVSQTSRLT